MYVQEAAAAHENRCQRERGDEPIGDLRIIDAEREREAVELAGKIPVGGDAGGITGRPGEQQRQCRQKRHPGRSEVEEWSEPFAPTSPQAMQLEGQELEAV